MDKLKLKWKIFLSFLGFCGLLLLILWLFQTVFLKDMYRLIRTGEMNKAIALVEENINKSNLQDILFELEQTKEIVVRPTGDKKPPNFIEPEMNNHRIPEMMEKNQRFVLEDGSELLLTFSAMVTPVEATISTLKMQF